MDFLRNLLIKLENLLKPIFSSVENAQRKQQRLILGPAELSKKGQKSKCNLFVCTLWCVLDIFIPLGYLRRNFEADLSTRHCVCPIIVWFLLSSTIYFWNSATHLLFCVLNFPFLATLILVSKSVNKKLNFN